MQNRDLRKTKNQIINNSEVFQCWTGYKRILVILAHPDDPEFFCGGTIALWESQNHVIDYCLLTKGERGVNENFAFTENIKDVRVNEQRNAANLLGVKEISYLDNPDGYLVPTIELRKQIVRIVRIMKPDIIVTCDPTYYYFHNERLNHADHRAAGQAVIDAVFPAVQNPQYFPELISEEHLEPHYVEEVWLSLPKEPTIEIDITSTWNMKIEALLEHKSQIGDAEEFKVRMNSRGIHINGKLHYYEKFTRLMIRR